MKIVIYDFRNCTSPTIESTWACACRTSFRDRSRHAPRRPRVRGRQDRDARERVLGCSRSPLPVVRENVISGLHDRVAREPALGVVPLRRLVSQGAGLNAAHPHPPLSANLLLSFTMKSTSCRLTAPSQWGTSRAFSGSNGSSPSWSRRGKACRCRECRTGDRKSTRLNSSHTVISYAV